MNPYLAKFVRYFYRYFLSPRILYGVVFISIGIIISKIVIEKRDDILNGIKKSMIVFVVLAVIETNYLYGKELFYHSEILLSYIGLLPCVVLISLSFLSDNIEMSRKMREISTGIYYTHCFVLEIVGLFVGNIYMKFSAVVFGTGMLIFLMRKGKWTRKLV